LSIASSVTSLGLVAGFVGQGLAALIKAYQVAPAEYFTLMDEVETTQHALLPLRTHLRSGDIDIDSRTIVTAMIKKIEQTEDELFQRLSGLLNKKVDVHFVSQC
jgi:hypothetical protein